MNIDVTAMLGAVAREVANVEHEGKPVKAVRATRSYDTDREDLWSAITTKERIERWLMPIQGDLRLGGRYALTGNASGTIERCEAPSRLQVTWEYGGVTSWVVATLHDEGKRTRLVIEHRLPLDDDKLREFGPGAVGVGWDLMIAGLVNHLSGAAKPSAEEIGGWMASPDGKRMVTSTAEAWGEAAIGAGDAPDVARAMAAKTRAAYGG